MTAKAQSQEKTTSLKEVKRNPKFPIELEEVEKNPS